MTSPANHRALTVDEIAMTASCDGRIPAEDYCRVVRDAVALYDLGIRLGSQYVEGTKWTEVEPAVVADLYLHRVLGLGEA